MWGRLAAAVAAALAVAGATAVRYGSGRWRARTRALREGLEASRLAPLPALFDAAELDGLPAPVRRYLCSVLSDRQPMIAAVDMAHRGRFNMSDSGQQWKPFQSTQRVVTCRPGFDWDARIAMLPGLSVRVHDAYVAGEGVLHASLLGLAPLVDLHGTPELAEAELMRFLAEAPWYPTALLPSQGVHWQAVDERSALATLTDAAVSASLLFRFGDDGLVESVRAEGRARTVGGLPVPTPWQGRWTAYQWRHGMLVPTEGEVAWIFEDGARPYWRGCIAGLDYAFAAAPVS
jgi:hypothetical protein